MAMVFRANVGRLIRTRRSLAASLVLGFLSWSCQSYDAPTATRDIRAASGSHSAAPEAAPQAEVIPGQYIITFADSVSDVPGLANRIAHQYGSSPMFTYESAIRGFAAQLPDQAVEALQHNPQIERLEQDQLAHVTDTQTPVPSWGLDRIDQHTASLDNSYSYANDGTGVNVYILDTGIRTTHVEFGGRAFGAFTAVNDGNGTNDCAGHGTHVAGTVGSRAYGVAKGVRLFAVRVIDCNGSAAYSYVLAGIDWVTKNRVLPAVANMSLRGPKSSTLNSAVQTSIKAGVVYVVAAGNDAADACNYSPSSTPEALTVAASNTVDAQESYSNFGSCVDLYAPGRLIKSTWYTSDTAWQNASGTSMSSPHVAGAAALFLASNPSATPAEVASAITGSATVGLISSISAGSPNLLLYVGSTTAPVSAPSSPPPTTSTDQPPTASFTASCPKGKCTFDGSGSTDDHGISAFSWSFGDGSATAVGGTSTVKVTHTYKSSGSYQVTLTVTDGSGQSATVAQSVSVKVH